VPILPVPSLTTTAEIFLIYTLPVFTEKNYFYHTLEKKSSPFLKNYRKIRSEKDKKEEPHSQ